MPKFAPFGKIDVPFAEPSWYRGTPTAYYQEKHVKWRKKVRDFVEKELKPNANKWDEEGNAPFPELRKKAYAAGVLSPCWPEELGGTPPEGGWDHFMDLIWHDELARSGCAGVNIVLFGITIMSLPHTLRYGSQYLIDKVAKPVIRGEKGSMITLTEPAGGSDLASLTTTAVKTPDGKHYVVNGVKKYITGGLTGHFFSTLVRTGGKGHKAFSLVIIDKDLPGVTVKKIKTQGWWSGNTTRVMFEDVMVPVENLIGKEGNGFKMMADVMNWERMVAVCQTVRVARTCLTIGIEFGRERRTFGKRLVDHQAITHKIANMARKVEAAQAMVEQLTFSLQNGANAREMGGPIALGKVQCTQTLEYCAREASQILGGASFVRGGKGVILERIVREIRVGSVGGGSEEIMLDLAMRQAKL